MYGQIQKSTHLNLDDLYIFTVCPKKLEYRLEARGGQPPPSQELQNEHSKILQAVIRSAYLAAANNQQHQWRDILKLIDGLVFKDIDTYDSEAVDRAIEQSKKIIRTIQNDWYKDIYRQESLFGFSGFNLSLSHKGDSVIVDCPIDMVLYGPYRNKETLILCEVVEEEPDKLSIYNDLKLRAKTLSIYNNLKRVPDYIRLLYWNPSSDKINKLQITIDNPEEFIHNSKVGITHILDTIHRNIYYPSIERDKCSKCPYLLQCSW